MNFGSLFAGIGGIDLGFERAGMRCAWQVEKDPFCQAVLAKHWPDTPRLEDIHQCGRENLSPVDIVVGGFPCQPFSVAGNRKGADDDRHLWPEMLKIVRELEPAWVVGENVPGLIPLQLDGCLSDLEACGYEVWTLVFPACAIGAPHRRERVWIVAHRNGTGCKESHLLLQGGSSLSGGSPSLAHATSEGLEGRQQSQAPRATRPISSSDGGQWLVEPDVGRVADGVPLRMDRLRALGNAVVPQCAQVIAEAILNAQER